MTEDRRQAFEAAYKQHLLLQCVEVERIAFIFERSRRTGKYFETEVEAAWWGWQNSTTQTPVTVQVLPHSFSEKLSRLRAQSGLSQRELAEKVGVTWSSISKYENGQSMPRKRILWALEEALACPGQLYEAKQ